MLNSLVKWEIKVHCRAIMILLLETIEKIYPTDLYLNLLLFHFICNRFYNSKYTISIMALSSQLRYTSPTKIFILAVIPNKYNYVIYFHKRVCHRNK